MLGQGADAGSLCTMVLEAILTLQDPETCLNPMGPALQRVPDETPTPAEVMPLTHLSVVMRDGVTIHQHLWGRQCTMRSAECCIGLQLQSLACLSHTALPEP